MLAWQSPAPDHLGLSCLIKSFLSNLSASSHYPMCVSSLRAQCQLLGEGRASVSRVTGLAPASGSGLWVPACALGAGCCGRVYLPQAGCVWGVHVGLLSTFEPNQPGSRRAQVRAGVSGGQRVCAGTEGDPRMWDSCGTSVWVLRVGSEHPAGPAIESRTLGVDKGWQDLGGYMEWAEASCLCLWDPQMCMCLWTWRVWGVCCTGDILPLSAQEEKRMWLSVPVSAVSPECGCCWEQCLVCGCLCDQPCPCPLCVPLCVCLWDMCSASLLVEPTNGKVAAVSFSLTSGLQAPGWALADGQKSAGVAWLEEVAPCNIP